MPMAYQALKGSADVFLYPGHVNAYHRHQLCEQLVNEGVSGGLQAFIASELLTALAAALQSPRRESPFFVNALPQSGHPGGAASRLRHCWQSS